MHAAKSATTSSKLLVLTTPAVSRRAAPFNGVSSRALATAVPSLTEELDVIFVGGGPGGYYGAIKASQLGLKTACVESRASLGGTCLNVGCIPSKALLNSSHHYHAATHSFKNHGIIIENARVDLDLMMKNKEKIVTGLTTGIESFLFKKYGVARVKGFGSLEADGRTVRVKPDAGGADIVLKAKNVVIATGSEPSPLASCPVDNAAGKIVDSTGALSLKAVPKHLVVVGAGVIGLELGSVWRRLGSKVTVVEFLDRITPGIDMEVTKAFQSSLKKQGFDFKLSTKVVGTTIKPDGTIRVDLMPASNEASGASSIEDADCVLVATGRRPFTAGLGLDKVGVKVNQRGFVEVDAELKTNLPGVYAIGDAAPGPMLAHKAEDEGFAVAETIAGRHGHVNYNAIPGVIYTFPELASVGLTEEQIKEKGIEYTKGTFPFMANSRAKANQETEGMVKILADKKTDKVLGIHILGPNAGEMIGEGVLALEYGASSEDIARTCHAHPTLSEAFKEAAMATYDKSIHM